MHIVIEVAGIAQRRLHIDHAYLVAVAYALVEHLLQSSVIRGDDRFIGS
jgi:hypothetical protein